MNVTFSRNLYDEDGDIFDRCLLLHFESGIIMKLNDKAELDKLIKDLKSIQEEVSKY